MTANFQDNETSDGEEIDLTDHPGCDWLTPVTSTLHDFVAKGEGYHVCGFCGKAIRPELGARPGH